jgi:tRNA (guanine37-N1)-methyltransferase
MQNKLKMKTQLSLTVPIQYAHILLNQAKAEHILDTDCVPIKEKNTFTIALTTKFTEKAIKQISQVTPLTYNKTEFQTKIKRTLKTALKDQIPEEQLQQLKTAFDQIGAIAILEIDTQLREYETRIAQTLLQINPSIKSVYRKDGAHDGEYRLQSLKYLAGEQTTQTHTIENGVHMQLDVATTYFSPRLANERLRIAKQVSQDEQILILFSGIAPQAYIIENHIKKQITQEAKQIAQETKHKLQEAKNIQKHTQSPNLNIVCVEINPQAHKTALDNIKRLKSKHIQVVCADAKEYTKELINANQKFDRIIMNLPKTAHEYLDEAISLITNNGIIHYYDFLEESKFDVAIYRIQTAAKKQHKIAIINGIYTVGAQGVKTYRICVDAVIKEN